MFFSYCQDWLYKRLQKILLTKKQLFFPNSYFPIFFYSFPHHRACRPAHLRVLPDGAPRLLPLLRLLPLPPPGRLRLRPLLPPQERGEPGGHRQDGQEDRRRGGGGEDWGGKRLTSPEATMLYVVPAAVIGLLSGSSEIHSETVANLLSLET